MFALAVLNRGSLAVLSGVLTAVCVVPYVRDIYRGTTRPQRVSWFVFATLSIVAAIAQFVAGAGAGALLAAGSALGFATVFLASIRRGVGGFTRVDRLTLMVAISGLMLSVVVDRPVVALVAVIGAELAATALTAHKAGREPQSETMATWMIDGFAGVIAIVSISEFSATELMYPVHHAVVNLWVVLAIAGGRRAQPLNGCHSDVEHVGIVRAGGTRSDV